MKVLQTITLAGAVALTGCAASQPKADEALKAAESAITAQHADAMRFAPEAFSTVMETYGAARAAYDAEDWSTAVAKAEESAAQARQFPAAIAAGKAEAQATWPAVRDSVGAMLTALGGRLDEALRLRQFPEGMTAADLQTHRARVDSLAAGLEKAAVEFERGDVAGAVHATDRVRMEAGRLMAALGLMPRNPHGM